MTDDGTFEVETDTQTSDIKTQRKTNKTRFKKNTVLWMPEGFLYLQQQKYNRILWKCYCHDPNIYNIQTMGLIYSQ